MKKIMLVVVGVFLMVGVMGNAAKAGIVFDKVECKTDSFTDETGCIYRTEKIKNFDISYASKIGSDKSAAGFYQHPKEWDLLTKSRVILFKIDGVLYTKKYELSTSIGRGYVIESALVIFDVEFLALIAESKECRVRLGCCKETFIDQQYKDGIKELLNR